MTNVLQIEPDGWPCLLKYCRPGLFVFDNALAIKTDCCDSGGRHEVYCGDGDAFLGGVATIQERDQLTVQPVRAVWLIEDGGR
jgi:hypothetical protein